MILLDDAFQHRYVTSLSSIVLTDYNRALHLDKLLPAGRLRESRHELSRANMVIVTKCPIDMKPIEYNIISRWYTCFPTKIYISPLFLTVICKQYSPILPQEKYRIKDISRKDRIEVVIGNRQPGSHAAIHLSFSRPARKVTLSRSS